MKKGIVLFFVLAVIGGSIYFIAPRLTGVAEDVPLTLYGNVDIRDVSLGFRVAGRVEKMHFEEGDRVKAGTLLASLDKLPLEQELQLREAEVAEARAALMNAEKLFARRTKLVDSGAVSRGAYDDALAAKDEAAARLATAEAQRALARIRCQDTDLVSPASGIILTRIQEPGAIIAPGNPVYALALDTPVWVRTYVEERHLGKVHPGRKATVTTDSGGRYTGQVGFVSPQAEFTPKSVETAQLRTDLVYRLRVIINTPDTGLRQGMPVTVTFTD